MKRFLAALAVGVIMLSAGFVQASEITPAGKKLIERLDAMHVDKLWLSGYRVDWRTGVTTSPLLDNTNSHTHCSAFAAAAAENLGVYLLHPPEHSATLLANAQQDWLQTKGKEQGWRPVATPILAQQLANQGHLVVVTFKSPNPKAPGHIAVVRPSTKSDELILKEGPQITQAGRSNYLSGNAKTGFRNHPGAFENSELLYFTHDLPPTTPAAVANAGDKD